jgi:hypothetical protein
MGNGKYSEWEEGDAGKKVNNLDIVCGEWGK